VADIKALLTSVSTQLRKAQNALFGGKYEEARAQVESAAAGLAEAKAQDPLHVQIKTMESQVAKLQKDLAARSGKGSPAPATPPAAPLASAAGPASPALPAGVAKRIRDIRALLERKKVSDALGVLAEIEASYGGQFPGDHPDYVAIRETLAQAQAASDQASQAREQAAASARRQQDEMSRQSEEWLVRLRAFAPHGAATFGHFSQSVEDLLAQKTAHADALPVWQAFQAEPFPAGKSEQLAALEASLAASFEQFPSLLDRCKGELAGEVMAKIAACMENLGKEHEGLPAILGRTDREQIEQQVAALEPLLADDPARWQGLTAAMNELTARDQANRRERAGKIAPRADAYSGADAEPIRRCAEQLVLKECGSARAIQTVIYKPEWAESTQWESASGTQRLVTRRDIYAQVVADCAGARQLFTVYITKELRSDKTWSELGGNVMYSDEMAPP